MITIEISTEGMTKRQVKAAYIKADIFLGAAVSALMFDHAMNRGDAIEYLMSSSRTT